MERRKNKEKLGKTRDKEEKRGKGKEQGFETAESASHPSVLR